MNSMTSYRVNIVFLNRKDYLGSVSSKMDINGYVYVMPNGNTGKQAVLGPFVYHFLLRSHLPKV